MEDQLITFETAKLAKEKGFDWKVLHCFDTGYLITANGIGNFNKEPNPGGKWYSVPTQSLLQRWLREKHSISVSIETGWKNNAFCYSCRIWKKHLDIYIDLPYFDEYGTYSLSYEEALEKGLQEALNLI